MLARDEDVRRFDVAVELPRAVKRLQAGDRLPERGPETTGVEGGSDRSVASGRGEETESEEAGGHATRESEAARGTSRGRRHRVRAVGRVGDSVQRRAAHEVDEVGALD